MARIETAIPPLVLTLLGLLAYASLIMERETFLLLSGTLVILQTAFFLLEKKKSFLLLVIYLFLYCFYNVWRAFSVPADLRPQGAWIVEQLMFGLVTIAGWLLSKTVKQWSEDVAELKAKLNELEKIDEQFGILTFQEFLEKAKMVFHGARRRRERMVYLVISLPSYLTAYQARIWFEKLSETWKQTVRRYYDVVGKLDDRRLIVLLSNVHDESVGRILDRFRRKWGDSVHLAIEKVELTHADWELAEQEWKRLKGEHDRSSC